MNRIINLLFLIALASGMAVSPVLASHEGQFINYNIVKVSHNSYSAKEGGNIWTPLKTGDYFQIEVSTAHPATLNISTFHFEPGMGNNAVLSLLDTNGAMDKSLRDRLSYSEKKGIAPRKLFFNGSFIQKDIVTESVAALPTNLLEPSLLSKESLRIRPPPHHLA